MEKLGPLNLYTLRLIGMYNRFYKPRQATVYLEKHGYIERTGRTDTKIVNVNSPLPTKVGWHFSALAIIEYLIGRLGGKSSG